MPTLDQEEIRKRVNQLLRLADESVKKKAYDEALDIVRRVYTIDLKNMYARAYEERVLALKIEEERDRLSKDMESRAEEKIEAELKRRMKEMFQGLEIEALKKKQLQSEEQSIEHHVRQATTAEQLQMMQKDMTTLETNLQKSFRELESRVASQLHQAAGRLAKRTHDTGMSPDQVRSEYESKLEKMKQQYEEAEATRRKVHEEAFLKMSQEHQRALDGLVKRMEEQQEQSLAGEREKSKRLSLEAYQSLLASTEEFGLERNLQDSLLRAVRIPFSISDEEHNELKRKVQLASYMSALRGAWQKGKPTVEDIESLLSLQALYGLSDEEHLKLTRAAKKDVGLPDETAVILVVEDDRIVREFICNILKQTYKTVLAAKNADEAIATALQTRPALILCDHHLGADSVSGVTFYEKIQQNTYRDTLKDVPFVLMSALRDEFFLKSAKNLGIKTILPKPFTAESLERALRDALH